MLKLQRIFKNSNSIKYLRTLSTQKYFLQHLEQRSLISVIGDESPAYLQGLITNDIQHLATDNSCQYALFLNSKGRVLYDSIVYRINSNTFYVECDSSVVNALEKHLKIYKLRRKIDINPLSHGIYALFDKDHYYEIINNQEISTDFQSNPALESSNLSNDLRIFKDPRVSYLGYRIISEEKNVVSKLSEKLPIESTSEVNYRKYRYGLGVGEGIIDFPIGSCFPLESNTDYLHGVSFHKGCYIGQELTARTFHTGVTRKRLMSLFFNENIKELPSDDLITHDKIKLGKLRGIEGNIGLAVLRIDLINSIKNLKVAGNVVNVKKPFWWPVEAPKTISSVK